MVLGGMVKLGEKIGGDGNDVCNLLVNLLV